MKTTHTSTPQQDSHAVVKAIETQYKGYRFRSRLEARWAVFFDELKMKWEYEPEGFDLGPAGWYLPDFRVRSPGGDTFWYEIKAPGADDGKMAAFARAPGSENLGGTFRVLEGDPVSVFTERAARVLSTGPGADLATHVCPNCGVIGDFACGIYDGWHPWERVYLGCETCDIGIGRADTSNPVCGAFVDFHKGMIAITPEVWRGHLESVQRAALAARSARFEHGEQGARV